MKDYDKNKELRYLKYLDVNNLYGWVMSKKLPVNYLNEFKIFPNLIKGEGDISLKLMFNIAKIYLTLIIIYHFHLKNEI